MSKLEDLVPPLELCMKIPDGAFADSALEWIIKVKEEPEVWERKKSNNIPPIWSKIPAPTLAEIMEALDAMFGGDIDVCAWNIIGAGAWGVQIMDMGRTANYSENDANPASAALKLWIKLLESK